MATKQRLHDPFWQREVSNFNFRMRSIDILAGNGRSPAGARFVIKGNKEGRVVGCNVLLQRSHSDRQGTWFTFYKDGTENSSTTRVEHTTQEKQRGFYSKFKALGRADPHSDKMSKIGHSCPARRQSMETSQCTSHIVHSCEFQFTRGKTRGKMASVSTDRPRPRNREMRNVWKLSENGGINSCVIPARAHHRVWRARARGGLP